MGLRLVSLALLLLALCRTSSAGPKFTVISKNIESSSSSISIVPKESRSDVAQVGVPKGTTFKTTNEAAIKLLEVMGSTMISFAFLEVMAKLPEPFQVAFANGWICDAKNGNLMSDVKTAMYGATIPNDAREYEVKEAKKLNPSVDCHGTVTDPKGMHECFCTNAHPLLACVVVSLKDMVITEGKKEGLKMRGVLVDETYPDKLKCREDALVALKKAGTGMLGNMYDLDNYEKNQAFKDLFGGGGGGIDEITKKSDAATTNLFCDAIDPSVEAAVKDLYAADALYWLTEAFTMTVLFGPANTDIPHTCSIQEFKSTKYGECFCKLETGFTFCIYKVLAEYFKAEGYLNCVTKTFDVSKKPAAVPLTVLGQPGGGSSPAADPGSSSAATSSLLLAPLAAAAAAVLLHH